QSPDPAKEEARAEPRGAVDVGRVPAYQVGGYLEAEPGAGRGQVLEVDAGDVPGLDPLAQILHQLADARLEEVLVRGDHPAVAPEDLEQLAVLERHLEVGQEARLDTLLEREVKIQTHLPG